MKEIRRRFEATEYLQRQQKTRESMVAKGIDLLIVYDPSNMCWLTGYDGWSFYVHQCLVIGTDGALFWFGRGIDANGARLTTDLPQKDIIPYPDHYVQSPDCHPMEYLAGILAAKKASFQSALAWKRIITISPHVLLNLYMIPCLMRASVMQQLWLIGSARLNRRKKLNTCKPQVKS